MSLSCSRLPVSGVNRDLSFYKRGSLAFASMILAMSLMVSVLAIGSMASEN